MYRERGAMVDAERLACNLLSSAPLVFNLFAPMAQELLHASNSAKPSANATSDRQYGSIARAPLRGGALTRRYGVLPLRG
jgi:hypothetical protein